jgi:hypothetical protein
MIGIKVTKYSYSADYTVTLTAGESEHDLEIDEEELTLLYTAMSNYSLAREVLDNWVHKTTEAQEEKKRQYEEERARKEAGQ